MINLKTFDLNLLRVFEAISHDGSVSQAADKLGLSQPAVSNALNRLRRELDDPLFVRTSRGMEPTPWAEQLASAINQGLSTIRAGLSSRTAFDPAKSERRFTLLMTDVGMITFLPAVLAELDRSAPNVSVHVREFGVERYADLLEDGLADIALGRIGTVDNLSCELIHQSNFIVLLSQNNSFLEMDGTGRRFIGLENYLRAPHILQEPRGSIGNPIAQALGARASERRIALSIPHATVLPTLIGDTDLVATIPEVCAANLIAGGALCAVHVPFDLDANLVYQWWHKRNNGDPGHTWFRRILATAACGAGNAATSQ
jgi:DNA-binding transcriptional LysR family regulator